MASTYDLADLALNDASDVDWAIAYVRFATRDKPNEAGVFPMDTLDDDELRAIITAEGLVDTGQTPNVTYYAAHRIAANLILGNPMWMERWSAGGVSEGYRDAASIARGVIRAGAWIDTAIADDSDGRVSFGQLRLVT